MLKWDELIDERFRGRVALAFSRATYAALTQVVAIPDDVPRDVVLTAFTASNFPPKTPAQVRALVDEAMPLVAGALSEQNPSVNTVDDLTEQNIDAAVGLLLTAYRRFVLVGGVLPDAG